MRKMDAISWILCLFGVLIVCPGALSGNKISILVFGFNSGILFAKIFTRLFKELLDE